MEAHQPAILWSLPSSLLCSCHCQSLHLQTALLKLETDGWHLTRVGKYPWTRYSKHSPKMYHRIKTLVIYPKMKSGGKQQMVQIQLPLYNTISLLPFITGTFILPGVREGWDSTGLIKVQVIKADGLWVLQETVCNTVQGCFKDLQWSSISTLTHQVLWDLAKETSVFLEIILILGNFKRWEAWHC